LFIGGKDADVGDFCRAGAEVVAGNGLARRAGKKVANDFESGVGGEADVLGALSSAGVNFVDNEGLFGAEAGIEELALAMFGFEEVAADADVGVVKALFEEGGFAGALDADEENGLHESS